MRCIDVSVLRNSYTPAIGILLHLENGRDVPLLDERGEPANLISEIASLRQESDVQELFARIKAAVVDKPVNA